MKFRKRHVVATFSSGQVLSGNPDVICDPPIDQTVTVRRKLRVLGMHVDLDGVETHSGETALVAIGPFACSLCSLNCTKAFGLVTDLTSASDLTFNRELSRKVGNPPLGTPLSEVSQLSDGVVVSIRHQLA